MSNNVENYKNVARGVEKRYNNWADKVKDEEESYDLYEESSLVPIKPFRINPSTDKFFGVIGKNILNFIIVILNSFISVFIDMAEIHKEKNQLVAHYWHSDNDRFEPELPIESKEYVDKNNYQQYLDAVDDKSFFKILLKRYWSYLYLIVVFIFLTIQVMFWMGYSDTSPKWGFIFIPLILYILNNTFHKYGI